MKVPLRWLQAYVTPDLPPRELAERLAPVRPGMKVQPKLIELPRATAAARAGAAAGAGSSQAVARTAED